MTKILLVEDNEINRDMLSRRLERKDFQVVVAVNGAEGVTKAQAEQPDLILMDIHLPVLDGWEATRQIKANPQTQMIPVIALTADAIVGDREKALAAGCDEYDTKPVDFPRLLEKISNLLKPSAPPPPESFTPPSDQHQQKFLLTQLRHELEQPIHTIISYSDLLLDSLDDSQALGSDLQKIYASGLRLQQLVQAILNPVLAEIQQQEISLCTPALRRELLTPLSTIIGYCEMLLEESSDDLTLDLNQIQIAAQSLLSKVNNLDNLINQHLRTIGTIGIQESLEKQQVSTASFLERSDIASQVLVVDDNASNCMLLTRQLERQGCQVAIASTAQHALQVLDTAVYDLILLNVNLLEIRDQSNLLEQLKHHETWQQIPVLLMAIADQVEYLVQGIVLGATDYIIQPVQSVLLHHKVSACLERSQLRQQNAQFAAEITQYQMTEASLKQQLAVQHELEHSKHAQQAAEIIQTDYFQQLQSPAETQSVQNSDQQVALPLKVLLVEDNELNRDMLSRRLLRCGYEVIMAHDGAEGVSMAISELPQLILMDISLPIMDGWEATQQLKANPLTDGIPIIALTAHAMTGDREKALASGCDDYDTKPIDLTRLLGKIEGCLKRG
jgi:CheY-like chemotaxis protein